MPAPTKSSAVLVTGAHGFVGACAARWLAARGHRVVAVAGSSGRSWRLDGAKDIETIELDLTSEQAVRAAVAELQPAVVVNCAAYGAYSSQADPSRIYRVNFDAVRYLLDAASAVPGFVAFVQTGSSSEYGSNCSAPREDSATVPDSDYAVSKVAASAYIQLAGKKRNIPAWSLRLSSVYGPYEETSRLVPKLLQRAQEGGYPPLANPGTSRDFVHVDDVSRAIEAVIERAATTPRGEIMNIGTGTCTTLEEIVARVRAIHELAAEPSWGSMPDRRWDHARWYSNPQKAAELLGWRAETSLEDGLRATARWMRENPDVLRAAEEGSVMRGAT